MQAQDGSVEALRARWRIAARGSEEGTGGSVVIDRQLGDWKGVFHANVESFVAKCWILPINLAFSAFSGIFYPILEN